MDARTVANFVIYISSEALTDLTNMKLNKLLYYAQGHYLNKYGEPLFENKIEAWEHGPVVPEVYYAYKKFGDNSITEYDEAEISSIPQKAERLIFDVVRKYGRYTASALRSMTHVVNSPWDHFYGKEGKRTEIPLSEIMSYFAGLEELDHGLKCFSESDFIGYRDRDGILVLPKDWDDGEI